MLIPILMITAAIWALYGFWPALLVFGTLLAAVQVLAAIFRRIPVQRK